MGDPIEAEGSWQRVHVMFSTTIYKIRSIGLTWKILIPFLFFAFTGTATLVYISLRSQRQLIQREEKKELWDLYKIFMTVIAHKKEQALSLATMIAEIPDLQSQLAQRDREGLGNRLTPIYRDLKRQFGILQLHLHIPPAKSFLRLHRLGEHGEMISYRKSVLEVMKTGKPAGGLEWGLSGLAIRGVVPVFSNHKLAGSVEVGFPFGKGFLLELKRSWGPDFTVYQTMGEGDFRLLATTAQGKDRFCPSRHMIKCAGDKPALLIAPPVSPNTSILLGPFRDYYGQIVGVVKIEVSRGHIQEKMSKTKKIMILVGVVGLFFSFVLTGLVAMLFVRPIKEIVHEAGEIAEGKRESRLVERAADEIGMLTRSLNMMLASLKEKREQVEDYARTLEAKVEERTADLVASEEKYRTLVENLPLIVYRILRDGTTEFVNPYFTEKLGYSEEEAVGNKHFWREKICAGEERVGPCVLDLCWEQGRGYRMERVVKNKEGRPRTFIDHAIPFKDPNGKVRWVDGIMMDITELKDLQERALRTEESKLLVEISARFAHEIRNPLVTAGGFARRLRDSLAEGDPHRRVAEIIVEEVARLESILKIILSTIEPISLHVTEVDMGKLMRTWIRELGDETKAKGIRLQASISPEIPFLEGDEDLLNRAFGTLLRHAILCIPEGEVLFVSLQEEETHLVATIKHKMKALSEEDLEQFFLPHFDTKAAPGVLDLPSAKIIIHRHNGKVDVSREDETVVVLRIELPTRMGPRALV